MLGLPWAVQSPDVQNAPRPAHQAAAAFTTPTGSLASPDELNPIARPAGLSKASLLNIENAEQETCKTGLNPNNNDTEARRDKAGH